MYNAAHAGVPCIEHADLLLHDNENVTQGSTNVKNTIKNFFWGRMGRARCSASFLLLSGQA